MERHALRDAQITASTNRRLPRSAVATHRSGAARQQIPIRRTGRPAMHAVPSKASFRKAPHEFTLCLILRSLNDDTP